MHSALLSNKWRRSFGVASLATTCLVALAAVANGSPFDTLVICPADFQAELGPWIEYRESQGRTIRVIAPQQSPAALQAEVRSLARSGRLRYLLLVGDVQSTESKPSHITPTNYEKARINTRWGAEKHIATDIPFADLDGDGVPDLAVGRIPADSPAELRTALEKTVRYEREVQDGNWQRRLDIVAGIGGFGALADAVIEAAGRQVFQQAVPVGYELRHLSAKSASDKSNAFCDTAWKRLNDGSLAWIYLGHGLPTELDRVPTSTGRRSILSVDDLHLVHCEQCRPLAVLVACYTGAFDAQQDCLAERLSVSKDGPVAVVAATRVTMPYGNTVFGYELLRATFSDRPSELGEAIRITQARVIKAKGDDTFRPSLDSLASGLSPAPVDLDGERREHVLMYHLFGDPLLRLRIAAESTSIAESQTPSTQAAVDP